MRKLKELIYSDNSSSLLAFLSYAKFIEKNGLNLDKYLKENLH